MTENSAPFLPPQANIPFVHLARNFFTNFPIQWLVPPHTKVVVVSDFFKRELSGGAELTTEALIEAAPCKVFRLNSVNLTRELILQNKDVHWVLCNLSQASPDALGTLVNEGLSYSCVEYDFKYCRFRSETLHQMETKTPCDCAGTIHGRNALMLLSRAKNVFWMSEKQRDTHFGKAPELMATTNHVVLSSCFSPKDLQTFKELRTILPWEKKKPTVAVLGSGSWIKGVEATEAYLKKNRMAYEKIPQLGYADFLKKLATYQTLAFFPAGPDTCPRLVIEAKLLGCKQLTSENVLHRDEPWFTTIESTEAYLQSNVDRFWKTLLG